MADSRRALTRPQRIYCFVAGVLMIGASVLALGSQAGWLPAVAASLLSGVGGLVMAGRLMYHPPKSEKFLRRDAWVAAQGWWLIPIGPAVGAFIAANNSSGGIWIVLLLGCVAAGIGIGVAVIKPLGETPIENHKLA